MEFFVLVEDGIWQVIYARDLEKVKIAGQAIFT